MRLKIGLSPGDYPFKAQCVPLQGFIIQSMIPRHQCLPDRSLLNMYSCLTVDLLLVLLEYVLILLQQPARALPRNPRIAAGRHPRITELITRAE